MNRNRKSALLILLAREMQKRGSWCGETHIQKAMFFLQELLNVKSGFEFILYRHGPFSFDLRDELLGMRANDLLELTIKQEGYGPAYLPTAFSAEFLENYPKTTARFKEQVIFIAEELRGKRVTDLEKLATAFFIYNREGLRKDEEIAERLVDLKPHISQQDACRAAEDLNGLLARATPLILDDSDDALNQQAS